MVVGHQEKVYAGILCGRSNLRRSGKARISGIRFGSNRKLHVCNHIVCLPEKRGDIFESILVIVVFPTTFFQSGVYLRPVLHHVTGKGNGHGIAMKEKVNITERPCLRQRAYVNLLGKRSGAQKQQDKNQ